MYSTVNVLTNIHTMNPASYSLLMVLLMAAAILTCYAAMSLFHEPTRKLPQGPTLRRLRHIRSAGENRC